MPDGERESKKERGREEREITLYTVSHLLWFLGGERRASSLFNSL